MAASPLPRTQGLRRSRRDPAVRLTLLELVRAVSESTKDDREVVAVVLDLLERGKVRLTGTFRDEPPRR